MKRGPKFLPSIFTVLNLFSGFLAMLQIIQGHYITAVILIMVALSFDFLDGMIARLTHQASDFGIEFDSLADMVSFCLVPAVLVNELFVADLGFVGGAISFFPVLFGGVRLARFNLHATTEKKAYFTGMPVPASAVAIGSYIWFSYKVFGNYGNSNIILPLVVVFSFLMVSNIRFLANLKLGFRKGTLRTLRTIGFLVTIIAVIIFNAYIIFPLMLVYIITHILQWLIGYDEPRVHFARRKVH
ncbi:MAG: CDP-diacylglycerol--serine O-phosphatidyltransferase [Candidatus Marinimicrobia bacterium]|jgi:CDP-diacylglycerol--serine O-phosphatidyltransferase|nr:CDP-diacylglycerol--serine O-phosphatidyltransferase [Candidatus Neomarinimicrobiota bacterium]MCK9559112.1 CDP-diacylglycerol--serine O-phosphatidyltransferase [Candidatus Neomarinimicrobiota bacterium]MDD5060815.1 CDP-diacylglycerol--serine O-phosphatidyltransferase [Candidatus Neomarinimicrobiota bacterium]MDD5229887.1 CDP-diacylglycerol--serine O-phosphatidyltransferase [Candidatus Neomarinimicrobiota bacterium]MDD5540347.1 CDP-diacylglycerol--serine O-phosphatidyltransferase [Candidatus